MLPRKQQFFSHPKNNRLSHRDREFTLYPYNNLVWNIIYCFLNIIYFSDDGFIIF